MVILDFKASPILADLSLGPVEAEIRLGGLYLMAGNEGLNHAFFKSFFANCFSVRVGAPRARR
ncbi:MAG: hypothetical protein WBM71_15630 [Sedimenticolaceae bacterium]